MATIAKGIGFGGGNAKGIILSILVLLFAVGLFFIPEIIDFQRGLHRAKSGITEPEVGTVVDTERKSGFMESVRNLFSAGQSTGRIRDEGGRRELSRDGERLDQSTDRSKKAVRAGSALPEVFRQGITWEAIRSKASVQALKNAESNALALAKALPTKHVASKNALYVYASGVRFILGGGDKSMDALQAFRFLEQLDMNVTETLQRERVAPAEFNAWARISLGPAFEESRYVRTKQMRQVPFNPQLQLVSVQVAQPGTQTRKWIEGGPAYVQFAGLVVGRDIVKVNFYRNGEYVASRVPRQANRFGQRLFKYSSGNARGVWTIRVIEKGGQTYDKSYLFYQRARMFPWLSRKKGMFAIPFNSFDPRIDGLFTYTSGVRNRAFGSYFSNSVGNGFSTF